MEQFQCFIDSIHLIRRQQMDALQGGCDDDDDDDESSSSASVGTLYYCDVASAPDGDGDESVVLSSPV